MFDKKTLKQLLHFSITMFSMGFFIWVLNNIFFSTGYTFSDRIIAPTNFFIFFFSASQYFFFVGGLVLIFWAVATFVLERSRMLRLLSYLKEEKIVFEVRILEGFDYPISSMQNFLESLASSDGDFVKNFIKGKIAPMTSIEIVAKKGEIRFFISTYASRREIIQEAIYTYYPNIQVVEHGDYTKSFDYDSDEYDIFPFEWKLQKDDWLPLKTYKEFNLGKDKEEHSIDPMASFFESMELLKEGETVWTQFVLRSQLFKRPVKNRQFRPLSLGYWVQRDLKEEISDKLKEVRKERVKKIKEEGSEQIEREIAFTMEEKRLTDIAKNVQEQKIFQVGMRTIYIAPKGRIREEYTGVLSRVFRTVETSSNKLEPTGLSFSAGSEKPKRMKRFSNRMSNLFKRKGKPIFNEGYEIEKDVMLQLYRDRMFWLVPSLKAFASKYERSPTRFRDTMFMTSEMLSTICHFPTKSILSSSVTRQTHKDQAPPRELELGDIPNNIPIV